MWKIIQDCPSFEVSDNGEVRHRKHKKIRKFSFRDGYARVTISGRCLQVHRVVAKAFLQDYSENQPVDHINRVRNDNRVSNLRMSTNTQNLNNKVKQVGMVEHIIELHTQGYTPDMIRASIY